MDYEELKAILTEKVLFSSKYLTDDILESKDLSFMYTRFTIKKKSGKSRILHAPHATLKALQHELMYKVLNEFTFMSQVHGFTRGKSVKTGALVHVGCEGLVNMDLKDFFSKFPISLINIAVVKTIRKAIKLGYIAEEQENNINLHRFLVKLITINNYELSQGAPTSPLITNLGMMKVDATIVKFIKDLVDYKGALIYSRYADDITVSSSVAEIDFMSEIVIPINRILSYNTLNLNFAKTRIQRKHKRMEVTGVVVNEKLSIPKWKYYAMRAKIHNLSKIGKISADEYQKTMGYLQWMIYLKPQTSQKMLDTLKGLEVV